MATIKAPYNFVPFNTEVVSPHWIELISHDIPFSDSVSGVIEFKLTAQTEIFVRDGIGQKKAQDNIVDDVQKQPHTFSKYQNKYFIPGTSIKGMIRNVLEILSFSKMEDRVNNHRYAVRDFSNDILYPKSKISNSVSCGWLKKDRDKFYLSDCGRPYRISHEELSDSLGIDIANLFRDEKNLGDKSAKMKYDLYADKDIVKKYQFRIDENRPNFCYIDSNGNLEGQIVFTGQPSARDDIQKTGKHLEFVFTNAKNWILVSDEVINNFLFAYYDHDKNKQSIDWQYWKSKLDKGVNIPVFFRKDKGAIKDIGLSMLYKIVYEKSVVESIQIPTQSKYSDFSDAIFGYINKDKALKGRVHIGHAFADTDHAVPAVEKKEVLASPKASYYPTYIRQGVNDRTNKVESYKTFMNSDAQIAGWKRYPVHHNGIKHNHGPVDSKNNKIKTKFIPLKEGAEFKGTVHYHNLRKVELGALLSALTFHGTENAYHNIGMAKPLGYGKVKLDITRFETTESDKPEISDYLCAFESYMNVRLNLTKQPWHEREQVIELVTMAQDAENTDLSYMSLDEHVKVKKQKEGLAKYSAVVNKKASIRSYCGTGHIERMKAEYESEKKIMEHTVNIEQVIIACRDSTERDIADKWEAFKQELLLQLAQKRKQIAETERINREIEEAVQRAAKKEKDAEAAQETGPDLNIEINRDSWKKLTNIIDNWGKKAYSLNNLDTIIRNNPNGFLPQKFHGQLFEFLKKIIDSLNKRDKDSWLKDEKNKAYRNKVAQWVGAESVNEFFKSLKSN
jgi:CRISPR-associated protein (TIGR03986 family)